MIEFEHDRIRVPAVHAGMPSQVAQDLAPIHNPAASDLCDRASEVIRLVRQVMRVTVRGVTRAAVCVQTAAALISK